MAPSVTVQWLPTGTLIGTVLVLPLMITVKLGGAGGAGVHVTVSGKGSVLPIWRGSGLTTLVTENEPSIATHCFVWGGQMHSPSTGPGTRGDGQRHFLPGRHTHAPATGL